MRLFLIALQFLTILPVKIKSKIEPQDFGKSLAFFPLAGLLMGGILALPLFIFSYLPHLAVVAVVLTASVILSGAIHLDGLADTCDGLCSLKGKDKALEIMRDSRIGTMGVIGIVMVLLLKFTLLYSLPKEPLWKFLIVMLVFGRWAQAFACFSAEYIREEGKAKYFVEFCGKKEFLIATLFMVVVSCLLMRAFGLILCLASALPVFLWINFIKKKIGGMTGDTIGATNEIAEVLVLFFALIFTRITL